MKIPKDPMNDYRMDECLMKATPFDVEKLHAARLKLNVINDGTFSPDWFEEKQDIKED